jgi:uncharacterized membrane protein YbhN (UPF0104 family)
MNPGARRALRIGAAIALSSGAIALLVAALDWRRAGAALAAADPRWIAVALAWSLAIVALRGWRWIAIQPEAGLAIATAATAVQTFYNRIAPMRLGELTLPHLLRRHAGLDATPTLMLLVVTRIVELAVLLGLLALAVLLGGAADHLGAIAGIGGGLAAIVLLLANLHAAVGLAHRAIAAAARATGVAGRPLARRIVAALARAAAGEARLRPRQRAALVGWTVAIQLAQLAALDAIVRAFGVALGPAASAQGSALALAGTALPLPTVGMVGSLEAGWVAGYHLVGVDRDVAILTGLAAQVVTLGFAAAVALPAWAYLRRARRAG